MQHKIFTFTSERLGYRPLYMNDFDNYYKLDSDPKIMEFFPRGTADAKTVKANMQKNIDFFNTNQYGVFVATELETDKFVGRCGFGKIPTGEIEVGYVFLTEFWGKGYASEALKALVAWAKQHIFVSDTIIAFTPVDHLASQKVMQKSGMQYYKNEIKDGKECVFYKIELR